MNNFSTGGTNFNYYFRPFRSDNLNFEFAMSMTV